MMYKKTFSCFHCSLCCKLDVILSDLDILRLEKAGFKQEDFTVLNPYPAYSKFILKKTGECCVFMTFNEKGESRCSVHPHRPQVCRDYPFGNVDVIDDCRPNLALMKSMKEAHELLQKRGFI